MENDAAFETQIREARRAERAARAEVVTAPSGARYKLCRPTPAEMLVLMGTVPEELRKRLFEGATGQEFTVADQIATARYRAVLIEFVMVVPTVRVNPCAGEFSVLDLPEADREFAWKWALGQTGPDSGVLAAMESPAARTQ